jgi:hypothetical protein
MLGVIINAISPIILDGSKGSSLSSVRPDSILDRLRRDLSDHPRRLEGLLAELGATRLDPRQAQDVVDHLQQVRSAAVDDVDALALLRVHPRVQGEHLGEAEDRVQRRPQLVRHVGQEGRLGSVGILGRHLGLLGRHLGLLGRHLGLQQLGGALGDLLLQPAVQTSVVQRHRRLGGEKVQGLEVVLPEGTGEQLVLEHQHAPHLPSADDRLDEHGARGPAFEGLAPLRVGGHVVAEHELAAAGRGANHGLGDVVLVRLLRPDERCLDPRGPAAGRDHRAPDPVTLDQEQAPSPPSVLEHCRHHGHQELVLLQLAGDGARRTRHRRQVDGGSRQARAAARR